MHRYHKLGIIPNKRHVQLRLEDRLMNEEVKGNKGFEGASSVLYHFHMPTSIKSEVYRGAKKLKEEEDKSLRMRHFRTENVERGGTMLDRTPLLFNEDVIMWISKPDATADISYNNSEADELVFVSQGSGVLESPFGNLPYGQGDYVLVPKGTVHKFSISEESTFLIIESSPEVGIPKRYKNDLGQIKERAPYSERDFRLPEELVTIKDMVDTPVLIKHGDSITDYHLTEVVFDHHLFDVVGWDGFYYPTAFSIHDFEPIVGRTHEPPPVHQTYGVSDGTFVVCSFCPRPTDFDENAIPAPYNHTNVDSDEVLYYVNGNFDSRKGVEFGSVTLHPDGLTHGPQPGKYEGSIGAKYTDGLAVMVDTVKRLKVPNEILSVEDKGYARSWLE